MADNIPSPDDAFAVKKKAKFVQPKGDGNNNNASSLYSRCRAVVVANLERYPAEMFGMLGCDDWEDLVRLKHQKTAPQKGSGGLDGTGRRTPAMSERFLSEVESTNEHLAESEDADTLVWKDLTEYSFSRAGLTRPKGLLLPWPVLVKHLKTQADVLVKFKKLEDMAEDNEEMLECSYENEKTIIEATTNLRDSAMSLSLLKESGIGKSLKKLIKASSNRSPHMSIFERIEMPKSGHSPVAAIAAAAASRKGSQDLTVLAQLEKLLQAWMDLAAVIGVEGSGSSHKSKANTAGADFLKDGSDLKLAEDCMSWRQLFSTLKGRAEQNRAKLGQKMRDNRKRENKVRPKIVKVRTMSRKREAMLNRNAASQATWTRGGGSVANYGGAKILEIRKEAAVQAQKSKAGLPTYKKQSGFGAAVAFAAVTKLTPSQQAQQSKRKAAALVALGGGKRMAVPSRDIRMHGTKFSNKQSGGRRVDNDDRRGGRRR